MRYFPAFLDLKEKRVVVIGQNPPALSKARLLSKAGAKVFLFRSRSNHCLKNLPKTIAFSVTDRPWKSNDFNETYLIVASSGDNNEDKLISKHAKSLGILINCVDQPAISDFTIPAMVERGEIVIGISTGGNAPVLARRIRNAIEIAIPQHMSEIVSLIGTFREKVRNKIPSFEKRKVFWDNLLDDGSFSVALEKGDHDLARLEIESALNNVKPRLGAVYLVGAGPGNPELMTIKASQLVSRADVIVYDRLVSEEILETSRRDAKLINVGKKNKQDSYKQNGINKLLLNEASAGRLVVRLKAGDPFMFGRGGEELEFLLGHGIPVSIVPGITSALGCGATAEIPMTHRKYSSSVTFVAAHRMHGSGGINWDALVKLSGTIVFYMGIGKVNEISKKLLESGLEPECPVAVIEQGTLPNERIFYGELNTLKSIVVNNKVASPAIIVVGEVTKLGCNEFRTEDFFDLPMAV
tara:strand:+ start:1046 stop:2449 length:1404 start_codon:yes stop_codon:yes gene_type:complete